MTFSEKINPLVNEYLSETDKRSIARIAIYLPGHNGQFFIADSAIFDLTRSNSKFSLAIYFSFNDKTKSGQKLRSRIDSNEAFYDFETRRDGRNTLSYCLSSLNEASLVAEIAELIALTLSPRVDFTSVHAELMRVNWFTLGK